MFLSRAGELLPLVVLAEIVMMAGLMEGRCAAGVN